MYTKLGRTSMLKCVGLGWREKGVDRKGFKLNTFPMEEDDNNTRIVRKFQLYFADPSPIPLSRRAILKSPKSKLDLKNPKKCVEILEGSKSQRIPNF